VTLNRRLTDLSQERTGSSSRFTLFTEHRLGGEAEITVTDASRRWPPHSLQAPREYRGMFGTARLPNAT
jgi:hypothetical protein